MIGFLSHFEFSSLLDSVSRFITQYLIMDDGGKDFVSDLYSDILRLTEERMTDPQAEITLMDPATKIVAQPPPALAVYGLGQFGFAMTKLFADKHPNIPIVAYDPVKEYVDSVQETRCHPVFHKGSELGRNVSATHSKTAPLQDATIILLAVPGQYVRPLVKDIAPLITRDVILLNVAKAIENESQKYLSQVATEEMEVCKHNWWFVTLSGGMIAEEVTKQWPIAADVACTSLQIATYIADLFETSTFKLNTTSDVLGVELAGALKNVVAIGAGFFDGLQYEASSKAAFVSEASREVRDLAQALGANRDTFDIGTHAWLGDLLTTCFGKSRNRYLGEMLGSGMPIDKALEQLEKERKRSEGYLTSSAFYQLARKLGVQCPLLDAIHKVLHGQGTVQQAIIDFWTPRSRL